jgi:hypothetical protein
MDSSFFSSTYWQYKKDTQYIAGWLAEKSQKAGYKRPDGYAGAPVTGQASPYLIAVSEFVPMAEQSQASDERSASQVRSAVFPVARLRLVKRLANGIEWPIPA